MPDQIREINIHEKIARGTATLADFKNLIYVSDEWELYKTMKKLGVLDFIFSWIEVTMESNHEINFLLWWRNLQYMFTCLKRA